MTDQVLIVDSATGKLKCRRDVTAIAGAATPAATTTVAGAVRLATASEATTGTASDAAVTPVGLKAAINAIPAGAVANATDSVVGAVELATTAEAITGTDTVRAVTPAGLKAAINAIPAGAVANATDSVVGAVELATTAEAVSGTDTVRAVTPAGLKAAINAIPAAGAVTATNPPSLPTTGTRWMTNSATAAPYAKMSTYEWDGYEWRWLGGASYTQFQWAPPAFTGSGAKLFDFNAATMSVDNLNISKTTNVVTLPQGGLYSITTFYNSLETIAGPKSDTDVVGIRLGVGVNGYEYGVSSGMRNLGVPLLAGGQLQYWSGKNVTATAPVSAGATVDTSLELGTSSLGAGAWKVVITRIG